MKLIRNIKSHSTYNNNPPKQLGWVATNLINKHMKDTLVSLEVSRRQQEKEKLRVGAGKFEVFEATPALKNLRGVFKKSPRGVLRIWYSADARRIPVKMASKVAVGSFTARLETIEKAKSEP